MVYYSIFYHLLKSFSFLKIPFVVLRSCNMVGNSKNFDTEYWLILNFFNNRLSILLFFVQNPANY